MADEELSITIDKRYWPRMAMRSVAPVLRAVGDEHGNIVIAAQPAKGNILVKGSRERIDEVKPALLEIISEHFPDAPTPPELQARGVDDERQEHSEEETVLAECAEEPQTRVAKRSAVQRSVPYSHKQDRSSTGKGKPLGHGSVSSDLLWQCLKTNSSFVRASKPTGLSRPFSAEPNNLMALHTKRFSGLANRDVLDVRPLVRGILESIELVQSAASPRKVPATAQEDGYNGSEQTSSGRFCYRSTKKSMAGLTAEVSSRSPKRSIAKCS